MVAGNLLVNTVKWKKCEKLYRENLKKADLNQRLDIQEEILKNGWTKIKISLRKNSEFSDLGLAREIIIREYDKQDMKPKPNMKWNNQKQTILMSSSIWDKNSGMFLKCMRRYQCVMQLKSRSTNLVEVNVSKEDKGPDTRAFTAREHLLQLIDRNLDKCSVHSGEISTGYGFDSGNQTPPASASSNGSDLPIVHKSEWAKRTSPAFKDTGSNIQRSKADKVLTDDATLRVSDRLTKQDPACTTGCSTSNQAHIPSVKHQSNLSKPAGTNQKGAFGIRSSHDTQNNNFKGSAGDGYTVPNIPKSTNDKHVKPKGSVLSYTQTQSGKTGNPSCSFQTNCKTGVCNLATSQLRTGTKVSDRVKQIQGTAE